MNRTAVWSVWTAAAVLTAVPLAAEEAGGWQGRQGPGRGREGRHAGRAERRAFMATLKGKSPAEACRAIAARMDERHRERQTRHEARYREHLARIEQHLADRDVPPDRQAEILAFAQSIHDRVTGHFETQHTENKALIEKLCGQADLTHEVLRDTLRAHHDTQRDENRAFHDRIRDERRAFHDKLREERKDKEPGGEQV